MGRERKHSEEGRPLSCHLRTRIDVGLYIRLTQRTELHNKQKAHDSVGSDHWDINRE